MNTNIPKIYLPKLKDSPSEIRQLNSFLMKVLGHEFTSLTNSCYYIKILKHYQDIKSLIGLDEIDMKNFLITMRESTIRITGDEKRSSELKILSDKITCTIVMGILYYLRKNQIETVKLLMYLFGIRFYSNRMHQQFKFCKDIVWQQALSNVSQKHLFKVKQGIQNAVVYLSEEVLRKHIEILTNDNLNPLAVIKFVYELRHRINQSLRSFSNLYYEIEKEMYGDKPTLNVNKKEEDAANSSMIIEKMVMNICTYGEIDKIALIKAITLSKLNKEVASSIVGEFSDVEFKDEIKFIMLMMSRLIPINEWCTENKRLNLSRKIIYDTIKINNTYSIKKLITNLIHNLQIYNDIRSINNNVLVLFITHYLTFYLTHKVC